jgi:hypothetical protein
VKRQRRPCGLMSTIDRSSEPGFAVVQKTKPTPNFDFIVVTATDKQRAGGMDCYSSYRPWNTQNQSKNFNAVRNEQILVR